MSALGATSDGVPSVVTTARIRELVTRGQRADRGAPLLILGEAGVGKDILARLIHDASPRRSQPFIKITCAVHPADRLEGDLFGHEKGAPALASKWRPGSFEFANHGTIYLDEIGNFPRSLVPRLLYLLRAGEVSRTDRRDSIQVDVRVIASTAHHTATGDGNDLWREMRCLEVVELAIPPLRQRPEEIPLLTSFFVEQFNRRYRRDVQLCPDVIDTLRARPWPGNVRELEEAVHRLVVGGAMSPVH